MIVPRNVTDSSCNSCGGTRRVVEFKVGRATMEIIEGGGLLVRLCYDCRRGLERHLADALKADDADLIARSIARSECKATAYNDVTCVCQGDRRHVVRETTVTLPNGDVMTLAELGLFPWGWIPTTRKKAPTTRKKAPAKGSAARVKKARKKS